MGFCYSAVKYFMCVLNIIFTLLGLLIIASGSLGLVYRNNLPIAYPVSYFIAVIIVGSVICVVGFCGCFGAARESNCLLITCSICMLLLAVVKIALIIVIFKNKSALENSTSLLVNDQSNHLSKDEVIASGFHSFEIMGHCCGTTGPDSYFNTTAGLPVSLESQVPSSCCPIEYSKPELTCVVKDAYKLGCRSEAALDHAMGLLSSIAYGAIALALLEITALFLAVYLTCSNKSHDGYYEYD